MATHKSALKRSRQSKERRLRNRRIKSHLKNKIKSVNLALAEKNLEKAQQALTQAIPVIARAAAKGVIHKRNAARKISRLTRKVNALKPKLSA
jgi:small subunit ribosomal protein S20